MFIKTLLIFLTLSCSSLLINGQSPATKGTDPNGKTSVGPQIHNLRDFSFSRGVDLQFLLRELGKDMDLNVLFDTESRLENRRVNIELHNVTLPAALDAILLQEGLYYEEAGPKTILVANSVRGISVPSIGVGVLLQMSDQLAHYFRVTGGVLVNSVREGSPASKAGLKAGDVIVNADGTVVSGPLAFRRAIDDKTDREVTLTIVRSGKSRTISLTPEKGVHAVL